jgi:predicted dehydrogenase
VSRDQGGEALAKKHGAEHAYTDYDAMLRDPGVEVLFIATPNALHGPQVNTRA